MHRPQDSAAAGNVPADSAAAVDDAALVRRVAEADRAAFELLYNRHAPRLLGFITRRVRESSVAQDVLQETFWQVWRTAARYDPTRAVVSSWLVLIAQSRATDALRRRSRASDSAVPDAADMGDTPHERAASAESLDRAKRAVAELPADLRSVIESAFYEGMTHQQIADRTGIPLGTIKTRIRTAMRRLKDKIEAPTREVGVA